MLANKITKFLEQHLHENLRINWMVAGKFFTGALVACTMLVAGCATSKLYPRAPITTNALQALIGTNVVIETGIISSGDSTSHLQHFELKTSSGVFITVFSRSICTSAGMAQRKLNDRTLLSSGLRLKIQNTKDGLDYISNPSKTSYIFRHENVLVQFHFKDELPAPFSSDRSKEELINNVLLASREHVSESTVVK